MQVPRSTTITCRSPVEFGPPSIGASRGIGYGPRSDSAAYWKWTGTRRVRLETTTNGIPFGAPSHVVPKSGWTGSFKPMLAIRLAESFATGSRSTRWFQGLLGGNIGQRGAPGSGWADTSPGSTTSAAITANDPQATTSLRRSIYA